MSDSERNSRQRSSQRATPGVITCPACGGPLKADSNWCPACNFTGADTFVLFPDPPPPLLPILDAAGILTDDGIQKIESAREKIGRRFPQFQWRICSVCLPKETSLPVFGFWLLNACPLHPGETAENRAWTILLLINAATGQAAVIPGYSAEPFLSSDEWKSILSNMINPWRAKNPVEAILRFLKCSRTQLELVWKLHGTRKPSRKS